MEENTPSKVGAFLSSAVSKILNLVMILVIIALAGVVVFFWNKNQLLEQENKTLQEQNDNFTEMNNQAKVRDVVVKEEIEEKVIENNDELIVNNGKKMFDSSNIAEWKTYTNEKLGFEVKHPKNWKVKVMEEGDSKNNEIMISLYEDSDLPLKQLEYNGIVIIPRGGFDYGWGYPIKKIKGNFGGNLSSFWHFEYATYPTQIRVIEFPSEWNNANRIEVSKASNPEIVDKVMSTFNFIN